MGGFAYSNLRFLVVDDFSSFRTTINGMLNSLGASTIVPASNGQEALDICRAKKFDVILCDYDLGQGRNGQRVLEALRHQKLIDRESLFVLISADVSKQAVMAAYDCTPDDYLAKPINTQMLEKRIGRLLEVREAMRPAYRALDQNDAERAIAILTRLSLGGGRIALPAQKFLGELFIESGELTKAEKLYQKVLENKPLEWARLGLAYVSQARGRLEEAGEVFCELAEENPLFLPAYDGLASNWFLRDNPAKLQDAIAQSVLVSPMSILRQKNLANIAEKNGDYPTALKALRECVRLGRESCHGSWEDAYQFGMAAAAAPEQVLENNRKLPQEALDILSEAAGHYDVEPEELLRLQFLQGRLQFLAKRSLEGRQVIERAEQAYAKRTQDVQTDIARIKALKTLGENERAEELVHSLIQYYAYDQEALERLDELLNEPVSEANRALVAQINREGIELYNSALFDDAIACFERAQLLFPKHVGIQLNIVQALIGKIQSGDKDARIKSAVDAALKAIGEAVDSGHSQYARYRKLNAMLTT
ncbi:MAG TPA: response regulator [Marinagarivorans sp.]